MQEFTPSIQKINQFVARLSLSEFMWPPVIIYLTLATHFTIASGTPNALIVYIFLLLCPGMAIIRLLDIKDPFVEWPFAIGLSIAINTVVSLLVILLSIGTLQTGFYFLAAISIIGSGIQIKQWFSHQSPIPQKEDA